jgi:hypothetical protein
MFENIEHPFLIGLQKDQNERLILRSFDSMGQHLSNLRFYPHHLKRTFKNSVGNINC